VYLRVYRKTTTATTAISGPWSSDTREWNAPLVSDANGGPVIYGGTNRLRRNTAATTGAAWTTLSDTTVADGGTLTAIATVAGAPGVICLDPNGTIDGADLAQLLGAWGARPAPLGCPPDINADGEMNGADFDIADLGVILNAWST